MLNERYLPVIATLLVFILLYGYGMVEYKGFRDTLVFTNLLTDNAFLIVTAVGMSFVIISGGIDLSVGSMIAFVGVLLAYLITGLGIHPVYAAIIALCTATFFGMVMGVIIAYFEIQPFIVTLAGLFLFRGLAYMINLNSVPIDHELLVTLSEIYVPLPGRGGLTFIAMAMLVLLAIGVVVAKRTRFGLNVYAVGGDVQSAALMGVPVKSTLVRIYALSGLYSGAAGVIFAIYTGSAYPLAAVGVELDAIAAVVIGGTLLTGGVGFVFGAFLGALIQGIIQTLIIFDGSLNSWWTKVAIGALLLMFILMQKAIVHFTRRYSGKNPAALEEPAMQKVESTQT